jgi:hypothetical protein
MVTGRIPPLTNRTSWRERVDVPLLVVGLIATATVGSTEFGIYWLSGFLGVGCPRYPNEMGPGRLIGGAASHDAILTAGAVGLVYWIAAGVAAAWFRCRVRYLTLGLILLYAASLIALWQIAPHIWGAGHCLA